MKQYFEQLPSDLEEAAAIDGASTVQLFFRVMLPLAAPGLIALTILSTQGVWNDFLHPLIASGGNNDIWTLPVGLALSAWSHRSVPSLEHHLGRGVDHHHPDGDRLLHLPALLRSGVGRVGRQGVIRGCDQAARRSGDSTWWAASTRALTTALTAAVADPAGRLSA